MDNCVLWLSPALTVYKFIISFLLDTSGEQPRLKMISAKNPFTYFLTDAFHSSLFSRTG